MHSDCSGFADGTLLVETQEFTGGPLLSFVGGSETLNDTMNNICVYFAAFIP